MSQQNSTITVYITCYNQAHYIAEAVESVLNQTRVPDQILVLDDASTDGSRDVIAALQQKDPQRIQTVFESKNRGIGYIRRKAMQLTTSALVASLDGDDWYLPQKLEREERALMQNQHAGFAYSNMIILDDESQTQRVWYPDNGLPEGDIFESLAGHSLSGGTGTTSELIRMSAVDQIDPFDPDLRIYEDLDFMLRLSNKYLCVAVNSPGYTYRRNAQGLSYANYAQHYQALDKVYAKNKSLLATLDQKHRKRVQSKINTRLAQYAWATVRQIARGSGTKHEGGVNENNPIYYANAAIKHKPTTLLNPKRLSQLTRALIRSYPAPRNPRAITV